eukprot:399918_1
MTSWNKGSSAKLNVVKSTKSRCKRWMDAFDEFSRVPCSEDAALQVQLRKRMAEPNATPISLLIHCDYFLLGILLAEFQYYCSIGLTADKMKKEGWNLISLKISNN